MIKLKSLLSEERSPKKGDIVMDFGEEGLIHQKSKGIVYCKFPSTRASSFSPIAVKDLELDQVLPSGKAVWKNSI